MIEIVPCEEGAEEDQPVARSAARPDHPGWTSRGYLPHRDELGLLQSVTFRLADSLPQDKLRQMERELALRPKGHQDPERRKRLERWLDAGIGCCALAHPEVAATLENTLLRFDGARYRLLAWCIMPTHVHTLIEPTASLATIVKSWKSYSGRWALAHNAELRLGIPGKALWMREYWDRYIRDGKHLRQTIDYIHQNPVKAGLCAKPSSWPWSSARFPPDT